MLWRALENTLKWRKSNWNYQQNADCSASVSRPLKRQRNDLPGHNIYESPSVD